MTADWRGAVLVLMARVLAVIALLPVLVGVVADPKGFAPFLPLGAALSAAAVWAGWGKRLSVTARSSLIGVPRKMMRSSKSLVYGSIRRMPYDVRSSHCGM